MNDQRKAKRRTGDEEPLFLTYLPPSLLTELLGVSNRQLGQYQQAISSMTHLGHRI